VDQKRVVQSAYLSTIIFFVVVFSPSFSSQSRANNKEISPLIKLDPLRVSEASLYPSQFFYQKMFLDRVPKENGFLVRGFKEPFWMDSASARFWQGVRRDYEHQLNEAFWESNVTVMDMDSITPPYKGKRLCGNGMMNRVDKHGFSRHKAYDVFAKEGTEVYPIANGVIVALEKDWWGKVNHDRPIVARSVKWWKGKSALKDPSIITIRGGNFRLIYHPPSRETGKKGFYSYYAHLRDGSAASLGQIVTTRTVIGKRD